MRIEPSTLNRALEIAGNRGILPSALASAAQRRRFSRSVRRGAVFSAKVVNADFLTAVYNEVKAVLGDGYENDKPAARLRLKLLLQKLQYDPATGFPGDEALGIEPAEPGSLQDLSSDGRIDLILDTNTGIMRGMVQREQDTSEVAMRMFPWWELVRVEWRRVPRGTPDSGTKGWHERWTTARGPEPVVFESKTRLIAPKDHHVWFNLGDSALFDDALDVDHPPFAFRSGYGLRQIHWTEGRKMGLELPSFALLRRAPEGRGPEDKGRGMEMPAPRASVKRMDGTALAALKKALAKAGPIVGTEAILKMGRKE